MRARLQALLTPKDSVLLLIDHQPFQFANLHSSPYQNGQAQTLPIGCSCYSDRVATQ
jgi:hypothetical protein